MHRWPILGVTLLLFASCTAPQQADPATPSPQPQASQAAVPIETINPTGSPQINDEQDLRIEITVGETILTAVLAKTEAAQALLEQLETGTMEIAVSDHGGFEKVGRLPEPLPQADTQITAIPGDILLYQENSIVFFYGENTWDYTRLAHIENTEAAELENILGSSVDQITLSLAE